MLKISNEILEEYLDIVRLSGVTEEHIKGVCCVLKNYQKYILFQLDKGKSILYFNKLQQECLVSYYKKQMYQIIKFLKHLKCEWVDEIKLPADPYYTPIHITNKTITETLEYFKSYDNYLRIKAVILLGCSSGLRGEEIYNLTLEDIDLFNRKIIVKHDPKSNKTTKTKKTRISFITEEARKAIQDYIDFYKYGNNGLRTLFAKKDIGTEFL